MRSDTTGKIDAKELIGKLAGRLGLDEASQTPASIASAEHRSRLVARFQEKFDEFVELLCDAAQGGVTPVLDANYIQLRRTLRDSYPTLKPFMGAFLRSSDDDDEYHLNHGQADAFEALFAPADLSEFLEFDDGKAISRITRTREALTLYGEHMRQLAKLRR